MHNANEPALTSTTAAQWLGMVPATNASAPPSADAAAKSADRLALIATRLQAVVGSQALVHRWLRRRNASLGDKPINLLRTPVGQTRLLHHLERFSTD